MITMSIFRPRPVFEQDDGTGTGPTDDAAKLLKEVMKLKAETKAAKERLAQYDGLTPERIAQAETTIAAAKAAQLQAEQDAALASGDWSKIKASLIAAHQAETAELGANLAQLRKDTENQTALITDLTIGAAFSASKFLAEQTILPGSKARKLYGEHFDFEDGQVIAYDAPRGAETRNPIVDGTGHPLAFDEAMKRIIDADPDRDTIKRSARLAGGKGAKEPAPAHVGVGTDRVAAALRAGALPRMAQSDEDDSVRPTLNHRATNVTKTADTAAHRDVGASRIADAIKAGSLPKSSKGGPVRTNA